MTPLILISGIALSAIIISHATTRPQGSALFPAWSFPFALLLIGIVTTTAGAANAPNHYAWHLVTLIGSVITITSISYLIKTLK